MLRKPCLALTFDDVLLQPAASSVLPHEVDVSTSLPPAFALISLWYPRRWTPSPEDAAIAMARNGGIGVIHKNLSIAAQAAEVTRRSRDDCGFDYDASESKYSRGCRGLKGQQISGLPIVVDGGAVGISQQRLAFRTAFGPSNPRGRLPRACNGSSGPR